MATSQKENLSRNLADLKSRVSSSASRYPVEDVACDLFSETDTVRIEQEEGGAGSVEASFGD